ncbi:uncharacterized protein LOC144122158 [Amblyomma americanum]
MAAGRSDLQSLFMLSEPAAHNQGSLLDVPLVGFEFVNLGRSTRNSRGTSPDALVGLRPGIGGSTSGASPLRGVNNEAPRPHHSTPSAAAPNSGGVSPQSSEVLLQNAMQVMQSLAGILQSNLQAPAQSPRVRTDLPTYTGYHDSTGANEYLDRVLHYQQVTGIADAKMLTHVVPVSLTEQATRWYRLAGNRAWTMEEFCASFRDEFLPANYEWRLRRELELRTQHPDESLLEYVRAMDELYRLADPRATNTEKVERVTRQAHPTFTAYRRGVRFRDLDELAAEAKRIQGDILSARAYRPPPPASLSLEPRCAWNGSSARSPSRAEASAQFADERIPRGWELSDRALDPFSYALRTAHAAAERNEPRRDREADTRPRREFEMTDRNVATSV